MERVNIEQSQPQAYQAMFALEKYLQQSGLETGLQELLKLRASRLNGCGFCTSLHRNGAIKAGISRRQLEAIDDWRGSNCFDKRQQAALAVTDALTQPTSAGLPDAVYGQAAALFDEAEMAQLIVLVATINAWNRFGIAMTPRPLDAVVTQP